MLAIGRKNDERSISDSGEERKEETNRGNRIRKETR